MSGRSEAIKMVHVSVLFMKICNLQFAISTSKPPAPVAPREQTSPVHKAARVQAVTCLAQLALPHQTGNTQGEAVAALNLLSPAATGPPETAIVDLWSFVEIFSKKLGNL